MSATVTEFFRRAARIPPLWIDGTCFVLIQMLTVLAASFSGDEAAKYISAKALFWLKLSIGELVSGFLALKMFRSTAYADAKRDKASEANPPSTG